jgi:chorismate mutase / prephenate dehydratase
MTDLTDARRVLDRVDRQIVELLSQRLETVAEIASIKADGLNFLRDHDRESELLARIDGLARELGLDQFRVQEIFREVIAMSLKAQEEALLHRDQVERSVGSALRASFQGTVGAYSHMAARKYFAARSSEMEFMGTETFAEALDLAETGKVGYAVLPIENTTAGSINQVYDLLRGTSLRIVGEEILQVRHCLAGLPGTSQEDIRRVLSHPQGLIQCANFLASLSGVEQIAFSDTAAAAQEVTRLGDPAQAAISSEEAAEVYELEVLARGIADQDENWTRFVVISGIEINIDPRIPAKTSLVFTTRHHQGALAECLNVLAEHGLSLSKLESRPVPRRPWEYQFYVDLEGTLHSDHAALAIAELRRTCPYLRVLGTYPARTTADGTVDRVRASTPTEAKGQ